MRNPVQSFPVDLHDIYEDARASMKTSQRRAWPAVWGLTTAAVLLGAGLGWYLAADRAAGPAMPQPLVDIATTTAVDEPYQAAAGDTIEAAAGSAALAAGEAVIETSMQSTLELAAGWLRDGAAQVASVNGNAWPVILHRAGDGEFYADLSLDGHIVNCRIDLGSSRSTLRLDDLPAGAAAAGELLEASDVVLEHLRLPASRFAVSDDPAAESVIGSDLLGPSFTVEERVDRLRLVPRTS
jgi:hypothetical protein